jgi:hypothetical protein
MFILNSWGEAKMKPRGEFSVDGAWQDSVRWANMDPITFLDFLRQNSGHVIRACGAPKNWIKKEHIPELISLIDSQEPAPVVCYVASAHIPAREFRSTIGNEAAIMVDSFRQGWGYPTSCSDLKNINVDELRRWYRDQGHP